jgi:hypothetical protein
MPGAVIYISDFQNKLAWKFDISVSLSQELLADPPTTRWIIGSSPLTTRWVIPLQTLTTHEH